MGTTHAQYIKKQYVWTYIRDALDGESSVKRANTRYLPMPTAMALMPPVQVQTSNDPVAWNAPYSHSNKAYEAYLQRARYPMIVGHTVRSLVGIAMRKDPTIKLPTALKYLEKELIKVYRKVVANALAFGRVWLVVDVTKENTFKISLYKALSGVDWKEGEYVVFKCRTQEHELLTDEYEYVRLSLGTAEGEKSAVYKVQRSEKETDRWEAAETTTPTMQGKRLNRLPVVCCGSIDLDWDTDPIPMEGIASCALQLYMKNADLSQAEFMSCNPILVLTGVEKDQVPTAVGSTVMFALPNAESRAEYVEPKGTSLDHMITSMDRLYDEAAQYGAQLLGASKSQVESGEALRLRQSASGATLLSVMQLASEAMNEVLGIMIEWGGYTGTAEFVHESDLSAVDLNPNELRELTAAWMAGGLSYETYYARLQKGGVADETRTAEEERALIEQEAPKLADIGEPDADDPPQE